VRRAAQNITAVVAAKVAIIVSPIPAAEGGGAVTTQKIEHAQAAIKTTIVTSKRRLRGSNT
jgi:hypothetical protein